MSNKTYTIYWEVRGEPVKKAEVTGLELGRIVRRLYIRDPIKWKRLADKWDRELDKQKQLIRRKSND